MHQCTAEGLVEGIGIAHVGVAPGNNIIRKNWKGNVSQNKKTSFKINKTIKCIFYFLYQFFFGSTLCIFKYQYDVFRKASSNVGVFISFFEQV